MRSLSEHFVSSLIAHDLIQKEERELYEYGFRQGGMLAFNMITTIVIGMVFGMVVESMIFLLTYIPLRSYSGGYHARTPVRCYMLSVAVVALALVVIRLQIWTWFAVIAAVSASSVIIFLLSPMEAANKPLDQLERRVYQRHTYMILFVLAVSTLLFWFIKKQFAVSVAVSVSAVAGMQLLEQIKKS